MTFGLFGSGGRRSFAGIDLGSSSIKAVVVTPIAKDRWNLKICKRVDFPQPLSPGRTKEIRGISSALTSTAQAIGLEGGVAVSLPPDLTLLKRTTLPRISRPEIIASLQLEVDQQIRSSSDRLTLDYHIQSQNESASTIELLFAAARSERIAEYLSIFHSSGLRVSVVDVESVALHNAFFHNHQSVPGMPAAILDIGNRSTMLNIARGPSLLFTRHCSFGVEVYTGHLQRALNLTTNEANSVIRDLPKSAPRPLLDSVSKTGAEKIERLLLEGLRESGEETVPVLYICGGGSLIPGLKETLSARLHIPVSYFNPFRRIDTNNRQTQVESSVAYAVATGLALRLAMP